MTQYLLIVSAFALATASMAAPAVIVQDVSHDLSTSVGSLGTLGGVSFLLYAAAQLPAGFIVDRYGARHAVTLCVVLSLAGNLAFALSHDYSLALVGRAVAGFGAGLVIAPLLKVVRTNFSSRSFTLAWGMGFSLAYGGGSALATAPLTRAVELWSWRVPFLILSGLLTLVLALHVSSQRRSTREPSADLPAQPGAVATSIRAQLSTGINMWWTSTSLKAFGAILFISAGSFTAFQALWLGPFLSDIMRFDDTTYGMILLAMAIGLTAGYGLAGQLSRRTGQVGRPVVAGAMSYTVLWSILVFQRDSHNVAVATVIVTLMGATLGFVTIGFGLIPAHVTDEMTGIVTGIVNTMPFIGSAIFQVGIGYLVADGPDGEVSSSGYLYVFLMLALLNVCATVIGAFLSEHPRRTKQPCPGQVVGDID